MKRNIIIILLLTIFLIPYKVNAENLTPTVDVKEKVYDFAELLTEEEEKDLYDMATNYIEKYNMDMVLVTIDKNPYGVSDHYTQVYSQDFYDYNGFGIGTKKDGIIVLIDMDNRYPFITTTGEAQLVYDDERIENMHDEAYNYLSAGSYYDAFKAYIYRAEYYASKGIPESNKYYCVDEDGEYYKCKEEPKSVNWFITTISAILGSIIPVTLHIRKYRGIRLATNANAYLKNSSITNNIDQFLTTFTSRIRRSSDSGSGGHGGGGSSISHGSSGMSHGGGGGRHF